MFGGKREKALEEELAAVKQENDRRGTLLAEISGEKDSMLERFAQMTASHAQMEKDVDQVREHMQQIFELAENGAVTAGDIHNAIREISNGVGTFDANHSVFMGQVRKQNEKIMEIVENNKHFTTPMKYIAETPGALKEESQAMKERAGRMMELSKNMSVLSLNAAIEAGRMGGGSDRFIAAAEEVRTFAESYEKEARELDEQIGAAEEYIAKLEEQVHHLNELLKENNISMGRLYKDSMQNVGAYDAEQIDLRGLIPEAIIGRADALQQSEREGAKTQERMLLRIGDIGDELKEQKSCADELEAIYKKMQQTAERKN